MSPDTPQFEPFREGEEHALERDAADPLRNFRDRFHTPSSKSGEPVVYLCGNSLGLQPDSVRARIETELEDWATLAVDAHFDGRTPWYAYHRALREPGARLVGALPDEVVMMNSLTVNLHLMMVSFYRPTPERHKILIEEHTFPSDLYAVQTQLRFHGFDPGPGIVVAHARPGEHTLRTDDVETLIRERGGEIALVMLGGVNYFTGQRCDMERIAAVAREQGCTVGFDLAHAAGNVELRLHDWNVDFAVWCSYKYLNAGPGAVAGCFVHERHLADGNLPRFAGWWGNDPDSRFRMDQEREFRPVASADGWQLSNPPILALAPLYESLKIFDEAGMDRLRAKSVTLTGYLRYLLERSRGDRIEILTPADPEARGCQLSLRIGAGARELFDALHSDGIVGDFRSPDVIRVAPVPLYNGFHDVWRLAAALERHAGART